MRLIFRKKKTIFWGILLLLIGFLLAFWPGQGLAQGVAEYTAEQLGGGAGAWIVAQIANLILNLNYFLGAYILLPLINFVVQVLQYNGFLDSYAVEVGWPLVRDLTNMFFVIILLVISFSTILHISAYHYKNTLLKLVIMALLINFSKMILGFMIDFAQVIMLTFVDAFQNVAVNAMSYAFGITTTGSAMVDLSQTGGVFTKEDILATVLLNLVFLIVASAVMMVYVAVLLWRVLNLWILVILSPFAFLAVAFPGLKQYSSEFWKKFWNQLTIGVILAFCLWLAFMLLAAGITMGNDLSLTSQVNVFLDPESDTDLLWERIYIFIVSIALLLLGLQYAQQAGGFAGAFAGKVSGKLSEMGSKAVKGALYPVRKAGQLGGFAVKRGWKAAGRGIQNFSTAKGLEGSGFRRGLKYLTKAGWEGRQKRGDELNERAKDRAQAYAHDEANRARDVYTSHGQNIAEKHAKQMAEDYSIAGPEDLKQQFEQVLRMQGGREKDDRIRGLFAIASKNGWQDDLMGMEIIRDDLMTAEEKKDVTERQTYKEDRTKHHNSDIERDMHLQYARSLVKIGKLDKDKVDQFVEDEIKRGVEEDMIKKYDSDDVYDGVNITSRQKQGKFLEKYIATSTQTGEISDEAMALIYDHEQNAKANGHLEDIGFARIAEKDYYAPEDITNDKGEIIHKKGSMVVKKGQFRFLDYTKKDAKGLTEADHMGLAETSKLEAKTIAKAQAHSFSPYRKNGKAGTMDDYFRYLREIVGGSDEPYRINMNSRDANFIWGGAAVKKPVITKEIKNSTTGVKSNYTLGEISTAANLAPFLSAFVNQATRNQMVRAYHSFSGQFVDHKGDTSQGIRECLKGSGLNMVFNLKNPLDPSGKKDVLYGINALTGKVVQLDGQLKEIGRTQKSLEDFALEMKGAGIMSEDEHNQFLEAIKRA
ncbi:hypothetical protein KJ840_03970 [Patescibacteria group bacterium]|nr:hypothetical protein [Patescibacteria group bacterium]